MKKKRKPLSKVIPSLNLYIEDIIEIIEKLEAYCEKVKISDNEFEYDSIEEIIDKKGHYPRVLKIQAFTPNILLSFDRADFPTFSSVYIIDDDEIEIIGWMREYFKRRKNWKTYVFNFDIAIIFSVATTVVNIIYEKFGFPLETVTKYTWLMFSYFVYTMIIQLGYSYKIVLKKKYEEESFMSRNKDGIILLIISCLVTIITALFQS